MVELIYLLIIVAKKTREEDLAGLVTMSELY